LYSSVIIFQIQSPNTLMPRWLLGTSSKTPPRQKLGSCIREHSRRTISTHHYCGTDDVPRVSSAVRTSFQIVLLEEWNGAPTPRRNI